MPPVGSKGLTPMEQHRRRWALGCGNDICARARNKCFARGTFPCDVLFVGQGPGASENEFGRPFYGPAGQLFQEAVIDVAVPEGVSYALTNLVACMPSNEDGSKRRGSSEEPDDDEVVQCSARLQDVVRVCRPRLVVAVGALARDWLDRKNYHHIDIGDVPVVDVVHPSAVLRAKVADKSDMLLRTVVTVRTAIQEYLGL